ncbi:ABC transporter ATP-binding protein [Microvirga sp. M2]|uniref:ABC transporter ATP-binding protein n=1 Tax=Microvirga sp. M2 TaxID=3073270 RepID=UPI0039C29213
MNVLEVRDVSKSYGAFRALDAVSLTVGRGEFVALLGPNGAGKTTLFQVLTGLFVPDTGTVTLAGHDLRRRPAAALARLGIVFQQPTLDLELSVAANLRFHARLHGLKRRLASERIATELARFHLADRADARVRSLSGGNRRRVELARALIQDPDLLLMDEATVGLDPQSRHDLLKHVHALCMERQVGVLWATHLVDEAQNADRVLVLHRGHLLFNGPPGELIRRTKASDLDAAFLSLIEPANRPAESAVAV